MPEYTEDCCFNYVRDHCKGQGCSCGCHQPRSVMRTKHESDAEFLAWVGESADKLCTHTVQAAFRGGWEAARATLRGDVVISGATSDHNACHRTLSDLAEENSRLRALLDRVCPAWRVTE